MSDLTQKQIEHFHQKGWIGPLDMFSRQEVELARKELEENSQVSQYSDVTGSGGQLRRTFENRYFGVETHLNNHFWCESLYSLLTNERVVHCLNKLGEEDLLFWRSAIFHRMSKHVGINWHQAVEDYGGKTNDVEADLVFPKDTRVLNFTVWIALNDISEEMGTLQFANGSHRERFETVAVPLGEGAYPEERYYQTGQESLMQEKSRSYVFDENDWEIERTSSVKAGQIVIFNEHCMHKALGNSGDRERWVVNARYIPPSVKIHPQRLIDHYSYEYGYDLKKHYSVLVSGRDNYGLNRIENIKNKLGEFSKD